jgi:Cu2+-exporting ATPase
MRPRSAFEDLTGKGVKATINGTTWLVGNRRLLEENGIRHRPGIPRKGEALGRRPRTP